jgi:hypothetical protein
MTDASPITDAAILAEINERDVSNLTKDRWHGRFAYVKANDSYFDLLQRTEYTRSTFNALYRHEPKLTSIHSENKRCDPALWFDENRKARGGHALSGVTFAAGEGNLVSRNGDVFGNRWRDARPKGRPGDVSLWLAHAERMIPNESDRNHVFNVMAHKRQHADIKINHAVLHGGCPGSGKDTLWSPFLWSIGTDQNVNVEVIRHDELVGAWGYALESEVLVINELRQNERMDKRAFENTLKPLIAAPPEFLQVNRKHAHPYYALNRLLLLAFSNERAAISLPSDDRRWFVIWSHAPRMADDEAAKLWRWYHDGGFEAVTAWLDARDVRGFLPGATPPVTDAKLALVDLAMNNAESYVTQMARDRVDMFERGVVSAPLNLVALRIVKNHKDAPKVSRDAVLVALKEAGWIDRGLVHSRRYPTKRHVWCAPELVETKGTVLRDMLEVAPPTLSVVK